MPFNEFHVNIISTTFECLICFVFRCVDKTFDRMFDYYIQFDYEKLMSFSFSKLLFDGFFMSQILSTKLWREVNSSIRLLHRAFDVI